MVVATLKNPKRKRRVWPIILLLLFVFFLICPVVLIYAFFYDTNTKKVNLYDNIEFKDIGNRIIVDSLDYAVTDSKINIVVTEDDVDNVIHLAMQKYLKDNKFLKKAYVNVNGNVYNFYLDLDGVVIKSRLKVTTNLYETEDKSAFVFQIKDVSLGRASKIERPAKMLLDRLLSESSINGFLSKSGLSMTYSQEKFALMYKKADLMKDMKKLTDSEGMQLYFDVIETMVNDNYIGFDLAKNTFAEGYIDLARLHTNEYVTDDTAHIKIQPNEVGEKCRDNVVTLINHGDLDPETQDIQVVFNYLFGGYATYEKMTDEQKALIDSVDMSYIDIDDKTAYKGFDLQNVESKLYERMKDTVDGNKLTDKTLDPRYKQLCVLHESDINDYIASTAIVGYTSLFHRWNGDEFKLNYITVDNFYSNIYKKDDHYVTELVIKVNVNGYHTSLVFDTEMRGNTLINNSLVFDVKKVMFGDCDAENLKDVFFNIMAAAFTAADADSGIVANPEEKAIYINFNQILGYAKDRVEEIIYDKTGEHRDISDQFNPSNITYVIDGASRDDNGTMTLSLIEPINID